MINKATQESLPSNQVANHSFNPIFAARYGVNEAVLIYHFQFWIQANIQQGINHQDGRTWTYQTRESLAAHFPYFSPDQVRRLTDGLVKNGVLRKGNYNKKGFDKTLWYAFESEEIFTFGNFAKWTGKSAKGAGKSAKPIPDSEADTKPDKEHICPGGVDAPSKDEFGHPEFIAPRLRGAAMEEYICLSDEQRSAYRLLMNVPPAHGKDERYNALVAVRTARYKGLDRVRKAILVYKQRLERGEKPKKMGAYLAKIINEGYEPIPEHAKENIDHWASIKKAFPPGSYDESRDGVEFSRVGKEVTWRMSPGVFKDQLMRAREELKEY